MKRLISISIMVMISCFSIHSLAKAEPDSGSSLLLLGESTRMLGRGGAGVADTGADIFPYNPAAIGRLERLGMGLDYGSLPFRYHNPGFSLAFPTSYGVLGGYFRMLDIPDSYDIERGYMFGLGGAKEFTENLVVGVSLNGLYGKGQGESAHFGGLNIGSIYSTGYSHELGSGFGIFNPSLAFALLTGIPLGSESDMSQLNQVTLGYTLPFYRSDKMMISLFNDVNVTDEFSEVPVRVGFESVFKQKYVLRIGGMYPQSYEYGDMTMGIGYKMRYGDFDGEISYSLVHYKDTDFVHYAGISGEYGKLDREPPVTSIEASQKYISPNYDGNKDFVYFKLDVNDQSRINGWKMQIKNEQNQVVKEYRVSERDIDETLSPIGFIKKIWTKKESMMVPGTLFWDGTNQESRTVPDGSYLYSFIVWDERDNISAEKTGVIHIDKTAPEATLSSEYTLFSPNDDNRKDTLTIRQDITTEPEDEWKAGYEDGEGNIVKSYNWKGKDVPRSVTWNGKNDNGQDVPEGLYTYFIACTDMAGNSTKATVKEISLTRKYQVADITTAAEYYSYSSNRPIVFNTDLSDKKGLVGWEITISDKKKKPVRKIQGKDQLPDTVSWDVRDDDGDKLDDGVFYYSLMAEFESGNKPSSFDKKIIVDSTPPDVDLEYEPSRFSPDGDGENDILTIYPVAKDEFGVKDWKVTIYAPSGDVFKTFSGKDTPPAQIKWDGIGENGELVESAADYHIQLETGDNAGNRISTDKVKLPIDVLVIVTERGLKIRISNIEFKFDSSKLTGRAFPILDRVTEILEKYSSYNVLIEGHTDDIGEEKYNLKLSERRAKAVMEYLVDNGIDKDRLSFRGMGETTPFLPNTSSENRRRNRRVEFLLIKQGQ